MNSSLDFDSFDIMDQKEMLNINGGIGFLASLGVGILVAWAVDALCIGVSGNTVSGCIGGKINEAIHAGTHNSDGRSSSGNGGRY